MVKFNLKCVIIQDFYSTWLVSTAMIIAMYLRWYKLKVYLKIKYTKESSVGMELTR
jgi:hypothetical protein